MYRRPAGAAAPVSRLLSLSVSFLLVAFLLALAATTSGCSKEQGSLVGTWRSDQEGETLEFKDGGLLYFTTSSGTVDTLQWQADDASLAIGVAGGGTKTFGYSIDDGVLTLAYPDVEPARYTRVELEGD
jgi:hypothetical protein